MGAFHVSVERATAFAHPTDEFRRHTCDQCMRQHVLRDDGAGRNHRVPTDRDTTEDCRICAQRSPVLNLRVHPAPVWADSSRVRVIREANVRSDENTVAEGDSLIDCRELLHSEMRTSDGKADDETDDVRGNPDQGNDDDCVAWLEAETREIHRPNLLRVHRSEGCLRPLRRFPATYRG